MVFAERCIIRGIARGTRVSCAQSVIESFTLFHCASAIRSRRVLKPANPKSKVTNKSNSEQVKEAEKKQGKIQGKEREGKGEGEGEGEREGKGEGEGEVED